jgi:hypothetical protein
MNDLTFSFGEVAQLILVAFSIGILYQRVSNLERKQQADDDNQTDARAEIESRMKENVQRVSDRQEILEGRFVRAIEDLNTSFNGLAVEIKTALARQDERIGHIKSL